MKSVLEANDMNKSKYVIIDYYVDNVCSYRILQFSISHIRT